MALDLSNLSPQDAIAALRSYPRRYGSALEPIKDDDNVEAIVTRPGPDGVSALDIAADTARRLDLMTAALDRIELADNPDVPPAAADATAPLDRASGATGLANVLQQLGSAAAGLADRATKVAARDWNRTGTAGGRSVTAFDVLLEGVRVGADNLHRVEETIRAVGH